MDKFQSNSNEIQLITYNLGCRQHGSEQERKCFPGNQPGGRERQLQVQRGLPERTPVRLHWNPAALEHRRCAQVRGSGRHGNFNQQERNCGEGNEVWSSHLLLDARMGNEQD